ncbi:hypothetical protein [uncultured Chloroflexus sp.]|uniref:hypothetical protein n=1 Tax=uncultured Chloroflexus sp. TaxID=214040 RepID=UPI00263036C7|nr:hypothetical protein [uncultured Chloroflexus sp.]
MIATLLLECASIGSPIPSHRVVELLTLEESDYRAEHVYRGQVMVPSMVLPEWQTATEQLFGDIAAW